MRCESCGVGYPAPTGIAWMFADAEGAMAEWRNRYDHARRALDAQRARVRDSLQGQHPASTMRRLERLAAGQTAFRREVDAILAPVLGEGGGPLESHVALRTRLPPTQGLLTYETNVYRDWCWGAKETKAALDEVLLVLGHRTPSRILVLGSGAGRLAYDLHENLAPDLTVALDINPLLACVGQRVSHGETITLTEFPLAPRGPDDVAIQRRLTAPAAARPGLIFALGDALAPPFSSATFDLVVTPWLLDILESPARALLAQVNRLLVADGMWINQGSVAFTHTDPAEQLTGEELLALTRATGFDVMLSRERRLPYLSCPESRHGRVEQVLTFSANRIAACDMPPVRRTLPDWIETDTLPIPALPGFRAQALATRTHAYLMSLIDGRRSLADIARILAHHQLMDEAGARAALKGFLGAMYDEATRAGGF